MQYCYNYGYLSHFIFTVSASSCINSGALVGIQSILYTVNFHVFGGPANIVKLK